MTPPTNELTIPNTTLLMSGQTTFNTIPTHTNGCGPLIYSNQNVCLNQKISTAGKNFPH